MRTPGPLSSPLQFKALPRPKSHAMKRSVRRRRPTSPAQLPDNDDILTEILLRLPPQPSSLPRAGLVCKRWRRLVTDPIFLRAFHHRTPPPIHGYFTRSGWFFPTQEPPDRLPEWRFSRDRLCREPQAHYNWTLLCCRHGLVLFGKNQEFLVVDPMTGDRSRVAIADEHRQDYLIAVAVVAVAGGTDDDRRSFLLVALFAQDDWTRMTASVYSSDSGVWSYSVSTLIPPSPVSPILEPSSLVGSGIYWFLFDGEIVRFDLETHSLGIIEQPPRPLLDVERELRLWENCKRSIMPAAGDDNGRFCLAVLSELTSIQFWEREADTTSSDAKWMLCRTVQLDKVLPVQVKPHPLPFAIIGFAEESKVIFISTRHDGVFMGDIKSMRFKKVSVNGFNGNVHPYSSF